MKTQAAFSANFYASIGSETDDALKMTENFLKKGYTAEQAKFKKALLSLCHLFSMVPKVDFGL